MIAPRLVSNVVMPLNVIFAQQEKEKSKKIQINFPKLINTNKHRFGPFTLSSKHILYFPASFVEFNCAKEMLNVDRKCKNKQTLVHKKMECAESGEEGRK